MSLTAQFINHVTLYVVILYIDCLFIPYTYILSTWPSWFNFEVMGNFRSRGRV